MAGINYARLQATALRLIRDNGVAAQIQGPAVAGDPYDPDSAGSTPDPVACVVFPDEYNTFERQNTLIQSSDRKVYVAAKGLGTVPSNEDVLIMGGVSYGIVNVQPSPGREVAYFVVQARG